MWVAATGCPTAPGLCCGDPQNYGPTHRFSPFLSSQLPAPNPVALDMSLQTPSDVKVKEEAPVEVDSSPPSSPDSLSESDSNREPPVKAKVRLKGGSWVMSKNAD